MTTSDLIEDIRNLITGTPRDDRPLVMKKFIMLDRKLSNGEVIPAQWMDKD